MKTKWHILMIVLKDIYQNQETIATQSLIEYYNIAVDYTIYDNNNGIPIPINYTIFDQYLNINEYVLVRKIYFFYKKIILQKLKRKYQIQSHQLMQYQPYQL